MDTQAAGDRARSYRLGQQQGPAASFGYAGCAFQAGDLETGLAVLAGTLAHHDMPERLRAHLARRVALLVAATRAADAEAARTVAASAEWVPGDEAYEILCLPHVPGVFPPHRVALRHEWNGMLDQFLDALDAYHRPRATH